MCRNQTGPCHHPHGPEDLACGKTGKGHGTCSATAWEYIIVSRQRVISLLVSGVVIGCIISGRIGKRQDCQ